MMEEAADQFGPEPVLPAVTAVAILWVPETELPLGNRVLPTVHAELIQLLQRPR